MPKSPEAKRGWRERRAEKRRDKELRTGPSAERLEEAKKRAGGGGDVEGDVKASAHRASGSIVAGGG
jgi:hypothetical protein